MFSSTQPHTIDVGIIRPNLRYNMDWVPTHIQLEKIILLNFLTTNKQTEVFPPGDYSCAVQGQLYTFKLLNTLLVRKSSTDQSDRFEIVDDNPLDSGGMGSIFPIHGTLQINGDNLFFKNKVARVVKMQPHPSAQEAHLSVKREAKFSRELKYLRAKLAVSSTTHTYIVMRRITENTLHALTEKDFTRTPLTLNERVKISIELLYALRELHLKKIIHRDIKNTNIFIDQHFHCTIFDFGLSKRSGKRVVEKVGTPAYCPPEQLSNTHTTEKADVFCMGITIGQIWQRIYPPDVRLVPKLSPNDDCFNALPLDPSHHIALQRLLDRMTHANPDARPTVDDALDFFENIRTERETVGSSLPPTAIQHEYAVAARTRRSCQEAAAQGKDISDIIITNMSSLPGSDVNRFIEGLGVNVFKGLSKASLIKCIKDIQSSLIISNKRISFLLNLLTTISPTYRPQSQSVILQLKAHLLRLNKKAANYTAGMDDQHLLAKKLENELALINSQLANIRLTDVNFLIDDIYASLNQYPESSCETTKNLVQEIKTAVHTYLEENLKRLKQEGNEALTRRLNPIYNIVAIVNNHTGTPERLIQLIEEQLRHLVTGYFGRSQLRDNITIAMSATKLRLYPNIRTFHA